MGARAIRSMGVVAAAVVLSAASCGKSRGGGAPAAAGQGGAAHGGAAGSAPEAQGGDPGQGGAPGCGGPPWPGEECDGGWVCRPDADDYAACSAVMCATCDGFAGPVSQSSCRCACNAERTGVTCAPM